LDRRYQSGTELRKNYCTPKQRTLGFFDDPSIPSAPSARRENRAGLHFPPQLKIVGLIAEMRNTKELSNFFE
jgi:hypothetical protein